MIRFGLLYLFVGLVLAPCAATAQVTVPPGLAPGATYHLVFATSGQKGLDSVTSLPPANSNFFGGLDQADWVVTFHAFQAGLPEVTVETWDFVNPIYQSILSDSTSSAFDRLNLSGPLYKTNGDLVATSKADLFDGGINSPIDRDELGNALVGGVDVWTGTSILGGSAAQNCSDWTSNSSGNTGGAGRANSVSNSWAFFTNRSCNTTARLYGVSPALTVPLTADFDDDNDVDGLDFLKWQREGGTATELGNWQNEYGTDLNPPATHGVPEPTSAALALLAALMLGPRRARRGG